MSYIRISNLHKTYFSDSRNHNAPVRVFDNFDLEIDEGEFVALFGPNGCGKSTLLKILAGVEDFQEGDISIDGKSILSAQVGYVFQDYKASLFPWRTVLQNIVAPLESRINANDEEGYQRFGGNKIVDDIDSKPLKGIAKTSFKMASWISCKILRRKAKERKAKVISFLQDMGLSLPLEAYPYQLSGGQQQMVATARALISEPDVMLMDEPLSSLDYQNALLMRDKIQQLWEITHTTTLFVSHNIDDAIYLADHLVILSDKPAIIKDTIKINLPRPRNLGILKSKEFFDLKNNALEVFSSEVPISEEFEIVK